jgi:signal transduction histidine kinase
MEWATVLTYLMHQNKLFNRTRGRLASWYAGVMGMILSLSGLATVQTLSYAHWHAVEQELESISGTLHDNLESKLKRPGYVESSVEQALPGLCVMGKNCFNQAELSGRHILGIVQQGNYYLHFFNIAGRKIALLGMQPEGLPTSLNDAGWQTLKDNSGNRYRQFSLLLKTADGTPWGYMQVGRSLKEYDDHVFSLKLLLAIGLPVTMLLVAAASWWLAGLAIQPIYQSYNQMQQFTADAAHELRTPVATIQATIESVEGASEQETQEALVIIERQNRRLAHLVKDLLLLSYMDRKALAEKYHPCCLNDLLSDLVESLSILEMAAPLKLAIRFKVQEPLVVMGDENQLCRLFSNLITNALHYTPAGGKVHVILKRDDHSAVVHVQDSGVGIAPAEQSRIFDRFYRVNSDRSRHTGGAGLGLAIAKAIAKTHQGTIQVESALGKGSTFTVQLPLKKDRHS